MKPFLWIIGIVTVLMGGFYALNSHIYQEKQIDDGIATDYRDGRYLVEGEWVQFQDGSARTLVSTDGSSEVVTQYFGNEARGDFDQDGDEDVAFLLTQNTGGSGTFFYLVGAIKESEGYRGTAGIFLGDRIAPQTTEFRDGMVIVNFADRAQGEPMTSPPSIGRSMYLQFEPTSQRFQEVLHDAPLTDACRSDEEKGVCAERLGQEELAAGDVQQFAFIKNVYTQGGDVFIDTDDFQWLGSGSGTEADGCVIAGDFPKGKIPATEDRPECNPNGFLIVNDNPQIRTFVLSPTVRIRLIAELSSMLDTHTLTPQEFMDGRTSFGQKYYVYDGAGYDTPAYLPFQLIMKNGEIIYIHQVYMP